MKLLFISASNINISAGDTVQLISEMNMWAKQNKVHYISHNKLYRSALFEDLNEDVTINFPTNSQGLFTETMDIPTLVDYSVEYSQKNDIELIICRGSEVVKYFYKAHQEIFSGKTMAYITDPHNLGPELEEIFRAAYLIKCQTRKYVEIYLEKFNLPKNKFIIQNPVIDDNFSKVKKEFDIVYNGKIAPGWGFEYLLDYIEKNLNIKALIIYGHFAGYTSLERKEFVDRMGNLPNVTIYQSVTRSEAIAFSKKAKLGYCFRTREIDNENSYEISTKLLEFCNTGVLPIVRNTILHREILGDQFCGLVNEEEELFGKISCLLNSNNDKEVDLLYFSSLKYTTEKTYERIMKQIRRNQESTI